MKRRVLSFFATVRATLREIFDESAYERFLASKGTTSSAAAYSEFMQETENTRARRPKCC